MESNNFTLNFISNDKIDLQNLQSELDKNISLLNSMLTCLNETRKGNNLSKILQEKDKSEQLMKLIDNLNESFQRSFSLANQKEQQNYKHCIKENNRKILILKRELSTQKGILECIINYGATQSKKPQKNDAKNSAKKSEGIISDSKKEENYSRTMTLADKEDDICSNKNSYSNDSCSNNSNITRNNKKPLNTEFNNIDLNFNKRKALEKSAEKTNSQLKVFLEEFERKLQQSQSIFKDNSNQDNLDFLLVKEDRFYLYNNPPRISKLVIFLLVLVIFAVIIINYLV